MTLDCATFDVRDLDLPDRPALATSDDLPAAVAAVELLHEQFRDQLAANAEGGAGRLWQRLVVLEQRPGLDPTPRHWSSTNGLHPRQGTSLAH